VRTLTRRTTPPSAQPASTEPIIVAADTGGGQMTPRRCGTSERVSPANSVMPPILVADPNRVPAPWPGRD
jgi:hypothetical protein